MIFYPHPTLPRAGGDCRGTLMKNKECGNPYTPKMQQTAKRYRKQEFQAVKQGDNNKT
jgi:hypothetical protein